MPRKFAAFVILAEMRTGSNHLQDSLNALADVTVHGEVFNPAFIGQHNRDALFGIDMAARQIDPLPLLDRLLAQTDSLPGFRYFGDHDPRVRDAILTDPRIAKVTLSRNPLECYVSWKIARATDQWRLTNAKMAKSARIAFDGAEFEEMRAAHAKTREDIRRTLQRTGQTAFEIDYAEITDLDVVNGLGAFLGSDDRLAKVPDRLKRQNPGEISDKVTNPDDLAAYLGDVDPAEPLRGPSVPTMMAAATSPLLCLPVPGGPEDALRDWMTGLDGAAPTEGMRQKDLRQWQKAAGQVTTFAIVRHPLRRAHHIFWRDVLTPDGAAARDLRRMLTNQHHVPVPRTGGADPGYDTVAHCDAFQAFLKFLIAVHGGQSALPVLPGWVGQSAILTGMAQAVLPQRIVREEDAQPFLDDLARSCGRPSIALGSDDDQWSIRLTDIVTEDMQETALRAYRRDYTQFGFQAAL